MSHFEYFINKTNVYGIPEINKVQFQFIIKAISLEAKISQLDHLEYTPDISRKRLELVKEFNKLTKRKPPETIYKNLVFTRK